MKAILAARRVMASAPDLVRSRLGAGLASFSQQFHDNLCSLVLVGQDTLRSALAKLA
jgi:hypothetical protein